MIYSETIILYTNVDMLKPFQKLGSRTFPYDKERRNYLVIFILICLIVQTMFSSQSTY